MAPSTQPPTIHICRLKGHSIGLIAKSIWLMSPMLPKMAHGGLTFFWWYDKISYAPAPSAVRPLSRQATSDFHWPVGHFHSDGWVDGWFGLVWGYEYVCGGSLEDLRISFLELFFSLFSLKIMEPSFFSTCYNLCLQPDFKSFLPFFFSKSSAFYLMFYSFFL